MLCVGECECQRIESRESGFLSRVFQRCFSPDRRDASKENAAGLQTLRPEPAVLGKGELHAVQMSGQCKVFCTEGAAWVTCPGRFCDYILKAGESLLLQGKGKVVITGGSEVSRIRICNG
jgi:hypothetical protein